MIIVNIKINRPVKDVWNYFTKTSNWSNWNGGEMTQAEWKEGGTIEWKMGGASRIIAYEHQKTITIGGSWLDTTYRFSSDGKSTQVTIEEGNPKGGATWSDGGYKHTKELEASLEKLKSLIESAAIAQTKTVSIPKEERTENISKNIDIEEEKKEPLPKKKAGCAGILVFILLIGFGISLLITIG